MKTKTFFTLLILCTSCSVFENQWDKALKENNRTAFINYIKMNPQSENLKIAKAKLDSLDWSVFYYLVPRNPNKDRIFSKGGYIPNTNKIEVATLSLLPQETCDLTELKNKFGYPDTVLLNPEIKFLFVVDDIRRILGISQLIELEDGTTTYGVNVFPSDIERPGDQERDNSVYNIFKGSVARYGRFDLLIDKESVKQIVINFKHGSLEKEKVDAKSYGGWVVKSSSDAMYLSPYITWLTLINDGDTKKIFADDSKRK